MKKQTAALLAAVIFAASLLKIIPVTRIRRPSIRTDKTTRFTMPNHSVTKRTSTIMSSSE